MSYEQYKRKKNDYISLNNYSFLLRELQGGDPESDQLEKVSGQKQNEKTDDKSKDTKFNDKSNDKSNDNDKPNDMTKDIVPSENLPEQTPQKEGYFKRIGNIAYKAAAATGKLAYNAAAATGSMATTAGVY